MWREATEADLLGVLNEPEKSAYASAATGDGQDVLTDVLTAVTHQCRGYIADNTQNRLAAGITLPDRVMLSAMHLARVEMLTRLDMEVSKDRADAGKAAIRFFERVADAKVQIEQPEGETDTSGPVQKITVLSTHERQATRDNLKGL